MRSILCSLAALALSTALALSSDGAIVFDNGASNHAGGTVISWAVTAEDFTLGATTTITDAHFWTRERDGDWDRTLEWFIFEDVSGKPGVTPLYSGNGDSVNRSFNGYHDPSGESLYEYDFLLDSPVTLSAGTYWFGLHLLDVFDHTKRIFWETTSSGSGNNGHYARDGNFNSWETGGGELAFYLTNDTASGAVPEFASFLTWSLLIASVVGSTGRRSRAPSLKRCQEPF